MLQLLNEINEKNPMNEELLDPIIEIEEDVEENEKILYTESDLQVKLNIDKTNIKCYKMPQQNINII